MKIFASALLDRARPRSLCYPDFMRREDIVAFVRRDWQAVAESKRRRWAAQKKGMTAAEALHVGDELRDHAHTLLVGWPTDADRREDLAPHVRVSESLRRVKSPSRR